MWRRRLHQPHNLALEARHSDDQVHETESDQEFALDGRTARIANESVASMSPTTPNSVTIANRRANDRKRPARGTQGITRPERKIRKRKSVGTLSRKKRRRPKQEYWPIKDIVDEETREDGTTRYLVEWEGCDNTGKPYKPDWVQEVTDDALQAWQAQHKKHPIDNNPDDSDHKPDSRSRTSSRHLSEGPDAPSIASHTRKASEGLDATVDLAGLRSRSKRQKVALDAEDTEKISSNIRPPEDSEESDSLKEDPREKKIIVELKQSPSFDPSVYLAIQLSQGSQPQITAEAPKEDPLPSQTTSTQEGLLSNRTIPDSQEPSAFSTSDSSRNDPGQDPGTQTEIPPTQPDVVRENSIAPSQSDQNLGETAAEIPSHQRDWAASRQTPVPESVPSLEATASPQPSESGGQSVSTHHSNFLQTVLNSPRSETQDPFSSLLGVPASLSSAAPAQLDIHQSRGQVVDYISFNHTSSAWSSHTVSPHQSQIDAVRAHYSSQAAQIVPHSLSQSEGILSPSFAQDFSAYNTSSDRDDILSESSQRPRSEPRGSRGSSQALFGLHGNSRISLSTPPIHGVGTPPEPFHSLIHLGADKSSDERTAPKARTADSRSQSSLSSREFTLGSQLSDCSVARHSYRPAAPRNMMEGAARGSEQPLSMKERLRQIRERNFGLTPVDAPPIPATEQISANGLGVVDHPPEVPTEPVEPLSISPALLVPSVEMDLLEESHPVFESKINDSAPISGPIFESTAIPTSYDPIADGQPATLDPSALTLSIENDIIEPENEDDGSTSIPTDDGQPHSDQLDSTDAAPIVDDVPEAPEPNILPYIESEPNEFIVTLPLASNIRPQYVEIIKETNDDLVAYNAAFTDPPFRTPEPALVAKVDRMFNRLLDACDIPPSLDAVQKIPPAKITKYIRSTNSKFSFLGRFLEQLFNRETPPDKSILVLVRPGPLIDLLNNLCQTAGFEQCQLQGEFVTIVGSSDATSSGTSWVRSDVVVTVYPTSDQPYALQPEYDVVIAFDHTYRQDLMPPRTKESPPLTLVLVTTTSIQHINMRISDKIEPLSRKNYLLLALCASVPEMLSPDSGHVEAHQAAELFADYTNDPDDDDFYWNHQEPPRPIFEHIVTSSQVAALQSSVWPSGSMEVTTNRKRSLGEVDEGESEAKRPKMAQPEIVTTSTIASPHIPDSIKVFLGGDVAATEASAVIQISVAKAEALAAQMAKLEAELEKTRSERDQFRELADRTKREVDSWTTSMKRIQPRYMAALRDRGIFQKERDTALENQREMSAQLQSTKKDLSTASQKNGELKQKLAEAQESLLSGDSPDLAKMTRIEKEVEEARVKVSDFEKKAASAQRDREFASNEYQNASHRAFELRKENDALQQQIIELARKADDNIVLINQTQQRNEVGELVRLLEEQRTIVKDRENELNRAREQLAVLKNGRRETRQSSVPRSPRLGVSSPRTVRRAATEAASGAGSRGTSPSFDVGGTIMPGIGSLFAGQQQGNGRYAHLRD
ncbi:hypothetical protein SCAR479_02526 [Seiridium cardinale]|uniref:Chromo domain-containing protein n=1 Tax=Seiridium cardinale TaxID=138064 RepID=A0ABR2Y2W0_9PEZI